MAGMDNLIGCGGNDLMLLSNMLDDTKLSEEKAEQERAAADAKPAKKDDPNAIWDEDEVAETSLLKDAKNTEKRPKPKYDMRYRQKITSDDAMGAAWSVQDNSSMSCRELIVKVTMPDTKFSTVKLDVNRKEMLVQAPKYLLALPLTESVDPDKGTAKWDSDACVLEVILPIVRHEDFMHYSMLDDQQAK